MRSKKALAAVHITCAGDLAQRSPTELKTIKIKGIAQKWIVVDEISRELERLGLRFGMQPPPTLTSGAESGSTG